MTLPELMMRIWDGDANEYFTHVDMNRVEYNANICAREAGVSQVTFLNVTQADQFRYDEAQKLENLIDAIADALGVSVTMASDWSMGRSVSYVDFERWESSLWACYTDMGGVGQRIPADKFRVTYHATLFANAWQGSGPYTIDLDAPAVYSDTESLVFVDHRATVQQRAAEYNAMLVARTLSDRKVRVTALSIKPREDIPIVIAVDGLQMQEIKTLTVAGWQGSGPWTQSVTLATAPTQAVVGAQEGMTNAQVQEMTEAAISASGISGKTLTVRALYKKPTVALPIGIMYDTQEVA